VSAPGICSFWERQEHRGADDEMGGGNRFCKSPMCRRPFERDPLRTTPEDFCAACAEKIASLWNELRAMAALAPLG